MAANSSSSLEKDVEFLAQCEEEFKDRYTENDEEFMKVFNAPDPKPPIMRSWYTRRPPGESNRRNRDYNRRDRDSYSSYHRRGEQRRDRNNHNYGNDHNYRNRDYGHNRDYGNNHDYGRDGERNYSRY